MWKASETAASHNNNNDTNSSSHTAAASSKQRKQQHYRSIYISQSRLDINRISSLAPISQQSRHHLDSIVLKSTTSSHTGRPVSVLTVSSFCQESHTYLAASSTQWQRRLLTTVQSNIHSYICWQSSLPSPVRFFYWQACLHPTHRWRVCLP